MYPSGMKYRLAVVSVLAVSMNAAQKFDVKIVNRQVGETEYSYVVPGSSHTNANANVNCVGTANSANCNGLANSTTRSVPSHVKEYTVTGATFTLQLPDGRVAVVNCDSRQNFWTDSHPRSCRIPLVNDIQAEFDGDKAKLKWPVSIDGKKMQSETYKILAVIDKP
jgi:hypothetical protein